MNKKIIYITICSVRFFLLMTTFINIAYCLITTQKIIFEFSLIPFCIPCFRFIDSGNILHLFIVFLFEVVALFLMFGSIYEIFSKKRYKFPVFLTIWFFCFQTTSILSILAESELFNDINFITLIINLVELILVLIILLISITRYGNKKRTEHDYNMVTQSRLKGRVKHVLIIYTSIFLFSLFCVYFLSDNDLLEIRVIEQIVCYIFTAIIALSCFIEINVSYKKIISIPEETVIPYFLAKINFIQVISFIIFSIGCFILFNVNY